MLSILVAFALTANATALLDAGEIALSHGDAGKARMKFERCLELEPKNAKCTLGLGTAYVQLGDSAQGRRYLSAYVSMTGSQETPLTEASAEIRASQVIDGSYAIDRTSDSAEAERAAALRKQGHPKAAATVAFACVARVPGDSDCQLQLGLARLAAGDKRGASGPLTKFFMTLEHAALNQNDAPQRGVENRHEPAEPPEDW